MRITELFNLNKIILLIFGIAIMFSCSRKKLELHPVSYSQFESFVNETNYITDAERYGWSIVQQDVFNFSKVDSANWKMPDGSHVPISKDLPVTQVSYNDAIAYCKWANCRLPSYNEYWKLIRKDKRMVVADNNAPISSISEVNVLGNVWELTEPESGESVRLAGGSIFCSPKTCHGTDKSRELFVDKETGNIHIGFAVVKLQNEI